MKRTDRRDRVVGKRIRAARTEKHITLERLSDLTRIDVSQLSRIERGVSRTSLEGYERICSHLGLAPAELLMLGSGDQAA